MGFAPAKISFVLALNSAGQVAAVRDTRTASGGQLRPKVMEAPQPPKRTMAVVSGLLWDKTSYVLGVTQIHLGVEEAQQAKTAARVAREHEVFKNRQANLLAGCEDPGGRALLAFLEGWTVEAYAGLAYAEEMLDRNVAFQLEGDLGLLHDRPALRALVAGHAGDQDAVRGQCLVTGQIRPIARLHPSIKGLLGAPSSGASLVSFNAPAYSSHGKVQGGNAPTSELAAFGYGAALNDLLSAANGELPNGRPRYRHRAQIGDATTVFWSDAQGELGIEAEALLSLMFNGAPPPGDVQDDGAPMNAVRDVMAALETGWPLPDVALRLGPVRIFVLGLSPNAGRLSVRYWHTGTLGELAGHFQSHWADMRLEPSPTPRPPALWRLLRQLAVRDEVETIPPNLAGAFLRAVMTGDRYPRALLAHLLMRIRTDPGEGKLDDQRVALLKAIIARDFRKAAIETDAPMSLDSGQTNLGYRLGRLFAVLEAAQAGARDGAVDSIRDRWGVASAAPARVFQLLLRQGQRHLLQLRRTRPGLARTYERALAEIGAELAGALPLTLDIESQARFAIGYYHQRSAIYMKQLDGEAAPGDGLTDTPSETDDR